MELLVLKLGKVQANWDKLITLDSFLLTAVAIAEEASPLLEVNTFCVFCNSPQLMPFSSFFSLPITTYHEASCQLPLASVAFGSMYIYFVV